MDTIVVGLWIALDPLKRHLYNLPMVVSPEDRSVVYQPQVGLDRLSLGFSCSFFTACLRLKGGDLPVGAVEHVARDTVRKKGAAPRRRCIYGMGDEVISCPRRQTRVIMFNRSRNRKVAIPALNDSPYIGMNVYNVVLTSLIVVFCDSLLSDRTTLNYLVVAMLILTSTTTALCLLFLPKVLPLCSESIPILASPHCVIPVSRRVATVAWRCSY